MRRLPRFPVEPTLHFPIIPDSHICCVWSCTACGNEEFVSPDFYQSSGTPVCCDLDMYYRHTRVALPETVTNEDR